MKNFKRKVKDKRNIKKIGAAIVAMMLVVAMVIGLWPSSVLEAQAQVSDAMTADTWKQSLGDEASTQYAGRIWTDKSVYTENTSFELYAEEGEEHLKANITLESDEDFLVAYSALATAEAVSGQTQAPVDVVFVVDISGSMDDSMQAADGTNSTRIAETVKALNAAIDSLMNMNKHTRVGVVVFSNTAQTVLPLGHYEKGTRWTYGGTVTNYFSLSGTALHAHVLPVNGYDANGDAITGTQISREHSVTGGTNIQKGIHAGMNMLATEDDTTAIVNGQELQRYPSVVLLSDGAPTYSSNDEDWWAPANNNNDGPGGSPYYGNGMKALMTGAYMKDAIDRKYKLEESPIGTTFYTIGMGITGISGNEQDLAYMTLNPGAHWKDAEQVQGIPAGTYEGNSISFDAETESRNTGISSITCNRIVVDDNGNAEAVLTIRRNQMASDIASVTVNGQTYPATDANNRRFTVTIPISLDNETSIQVNKEDNTSVTYTLTASVNTDENDSMAELISKAWAEYAKGNNPTVDTNSNETYTFNHPKGEEAAYDIHEKTYMYKVLDDNNEWKEVSGNALQALVDSYYDADDANSVAAVFNQIVTNIALNTAQVPTAIQAGEALNSTGWVIYEDPIGEYMQVTEIKQIIYGGHQFLLKEVKEGDAKYPTSITIPKDAIVYVANNHYRDQTDFNTKIDTGVYAGSDAADIIVMVRTDAQGKQTLSVHIPASTIPVRINTVTLKTAVDAQGNEYEYVVDHTNNGTYPVRVIYGVGFKDDVIKTVDTANGKVEVVNTNVVSADYLTKNTNPEDGSVNFYSNYYDGTNTDTLLDGKTYTAGNAKVTFVPALTNPFYFLQEDTPIYTDEDCTIPASTSAPLDDNTTYYYKDTYYHLKDEVTTALVRTGAQLKNSGVIEVDGVWHRRAGTPRLNRIVALVTPKTENTTNTAELYYAPQYDKDHSIEGSTTGHMTVWLGNNGVLSKMGSGVLEISKNVIADEGLTAPIPENGFEFTIELENDDTYTYDVLDTATGTVLETKSLTITDGKGKLYLNHGETARIIGLVYETDYRVTEALVDGYTVTPAEATGTILVGEVAKADFNNHYKVTSTNWPTDGGITGTKTLSGRQWDEDDTFTFLLTPFNNAPLPGGAKDQVAVTVTGKDVAGTTAVQNFNFGQITFTAPGVYRYTVVEKEPTANTEIAGVSYSRALYRIVVTVEDNGKGALVATTDTQKLYDNDGTQLFKYDENNNIIVNEHAQDDIAFVNRFSAESVTKVPVAVKLYTDKSGQKPLTSGMFKFELTPYGIVTDEGVDTTKEAVAKVPMPIENGQKKEKVETSNEGINITFLPITFTQDDLGANHSAITYRYKLVELDNGIPGMNYARDPEYIDVKLSIEDGVLKVQASYEGLPDEADDRLPTFVNVYEPKSTEATLQGQKILTGRDMKQGESYKFKVDVTDNDTFTSEALAKGNVVQDKTENPVTTEKTVTGGKDGVAVPFDFGTWSFKLPGTYRFSISEEIADLVKDGVTYDAHVANVVIQIDDVNGQLQVSSITYDNSQAADADAAAVTDKAAFVNVYKANFTGAAVSLDGTKTLTGQTLEAQEFRFGITSDVDETTGKAKANATWNYVANHVGTDTDADGKYEGSITFLKDVTYTEAGTYTYIIGEYLPEHAILGMENDHTVYKLVVTVTDDGNGNLYVGTSKEDDTDGIDVYKSEDYHTATNPTWTQVNVDEVVFDNTYAPIPTVRMGSLMTKVLEGRTIKAGDFTFKRTILSATTEGGITLMKDATTPADQGNDTVSNNADGTFSFGPMKFTKAGTYVVQIAEVIPTEAEGATYDILAEAWVKDGVYYTAKPLTATFVVEDDQRGTLTVRATNVTGTTFVNTYKAEGILDLQIQKDFTGRVNNVATDLDNWLDSDVFKFTIDSADTVTDTAIAEGYIELPTGAVTIDKNTPNRQAYLEGIYIYKAGTYTFVIAEDRSADIPGVVYSTPRKLTVTATDDEEGGLDFTYSMLDTNATEEPIVFKNTYTTGSTTLSGHFNLGVHKQFTGRVDDDPNNMDNWLDSDAFAFKLEASNDVTRAAIARYEDTKNTNDVKGIKLPENVSELIVTKGNIHHAHFDAITFYEEGTFTFKVTELWPNEATAGNNYTVNGITYTTETKVIKVEVTDNNDGTLTAVKTNNSDELTFVNTYQAKPGTLDSTYLTVEKKLTGRDWNGDEFAFELKAENAVTQAAIDAGDIELSNPRITVTRNNLVGEKYTNVFGAITFKKIGTYAFEISEVQPDNPIAGITYDTHQAVVTVTVYDDGNGQLIVANPQSQTNSNPAYTGSLTFTNVYTPDTKEVSLKGKKEINGRNLTEDDEFVFTIEVAAGSKANTPLPNVTRVVNNMDKIAFGPIVFGADKTQVAGYAAGTYKYIIRESAGADGVHGITTDKGYVEATVNVTYNETTGQYEVSEPVYKKINPVGQETEFTFVNTYEATGTLEGRTNLRVTKNFTGRSGNEWLDTDKFDFTLALHSGDATKVAFTNQSLTVTKNNKNNAFFGNITLKEKGDYQFVIQETDSGVAGITYDTVKRIIKVHADDNGDGTLKISIVGIEDEQGGNSSLTFNNTYDTDETTLKGETNLKVNKSFTGRVNDEWLDTDKFDFTLAIDETHATTKGAFDKGDIAFTNTTLEVNKTNKNTAHFGDITFKEPGLYRFVIREIKGEHGYIKYDTTPRIILVNVVDNNNGSMTASIVSSESDKLEFKNEYVVQATTATLEGTKKIDGREVKDTDKFEFTISAVTVDAPMPTDTTVENATKVISFGTITYTKAGTYVYEIRETGGSVTGVTNTTNVVTATVTVTDNKAGQLESKVEYSTGGLEFEFVNKYETQPTDPISITATKKVTPSEGNSYTMKAGKFDFTITSAQTDGNPISGGTVSNDANGNVVFATSAQFTKEGKYVYIIQETDGTLGGMSYSQAVYTVTVDVVDDVAAAKLGATITVEEGIKGQTATTPVTGAVTIDGNQQIIILPFENKYNPKETNSNISGKKVLDVSGNPDITLNAGDFTFKLEAVDNAPLPDNANGQAVTVTNDVAGGFSFGEITFKAQGTYKYKVSEVDADKKGYTYDEAVYDVTIVVEDHDGELTVTQNTSGADKVVFENSYKPDPVTLQGDTAIKGTKTLKGRDMKAEEFSFTITPAKDSNPMPKEVTVKNAKDGSFSFEPITFNTVGEYTYTITEQKGTLGGVTYDEQVYTVKVTVTDEGGYLAADVEYPQDGVEFKNAYKATVSAKVSLDAKKKLTGRDLKEGEFTFQLFDKEGKVVATAKNGANGAILFDALTFDTVGTYVYTVKEVAGDAKGITYDEAAYTVTIKVVDDMNGSLKAETSVTKDGKAVDAMEFVNVYKDSAPQTSDAVTYLPAMVMLLLAASSVAVVLKRRRVTK